MLARLQKCVVVALVVSSLIWAAYLVHHGRPGWAVTGAALILLGYGLFLGIEFAILCFVQSSVPEPRPRAAQLLRAWFAEVVCAPKVFFWRQPFRSLAEPDSSAPGGGRRPGVILVHGFVCNRGLWNPWMRALRLRGVPFIGVNLEPVFGSIDDYPRLIETAVARIEAATAMPVVLVGHSMGGLAIRAWLAKYDADMRVRRVITIGTPHGGTWLARYGHTHNGKQMRLGSPWLARLAALESAARRARFTCFYGHCDNIVFPTASGMLAGAQNIHLPATAHVQMAFQPTVFNEVCRWLEPETAAPDGRPGPATAAQ